MSQFGKFELLFMIRETEDLNSCTIKLLAGGLTTGFCSLAICYCNAWPAGAYKNHGTQSIKINTFMCDVTVINLVAFNINV